MVIWGVMTWWYTNGWRQLALGIKERIEGTLDYFSIDLLAKTLFAPYRQISAGQVRGSFDMQVGAFFDRQISRFIGMTVRLIMILSGSITILLHIFFGVVALSLWAFVPLLPFIGLFLFMIGWMPWSN